MGVRSAVCGRFPSICAPAALPGLRPLARRALNACEEPVEGCVERSITCVLEGRNLSPEEPLLVAAWPGSPAAWSPLAAWRGSPECLRVSALRPSQREGVPLRVGAPISLQTNLPALPFGSLCLPLCPRV